jgi:diguanylate cyclase (GGDEF)-like protein
VLQDALKRVVQANENQAMRAEGAFLRGELSREEFAQVRREIREKFFESFNMKESQLRRLGERDSKFGAVFNDKTFRRMAREKMASGQRYVLCIFDIDDFKRVNDALGHVAGDHALRFLSLALANTARSWAGFSGRLGGEEFGLVVPGDLRTVQRVMPLLNRRLVTEFYRNQFLRSSFRNRLFTFSAGVAEMDPARSFDDAFEEADARLYVAKRAGKNRVANGQEVVKIR